MTFHRVIIDDGAHNNNINSIRNKQVSRIYTHDGQQAHTKVLVLNSSRKKEREKFLKKK